MSGFTSLDDQDNELLDPRIQDELESLNTLSSEINDLEKANDTANESFRNLLSQSAAQLKLVSSDIGPKSVDKARPYYVALTKAREAQKLTQLAALEFQRANGIHRAAKETIRLAETKFEEIQHSGFDAAWQEMLNHATLKVNESEAHKIESEQRHRLTAAEFTRMDRTVTHLENFIGRSNINKTRPYFELKDRYNAQLEAQKEKILRLQNDVTSRKEAYRGCLKRLERISEEIHRKRLRRRKSPSTPNSTSDVTPSDIDPKMVLPTALVSCSTALQVELVNQQTSSSTTYPNYPLLQEGLSSEANFSYVAPKNAKSQEPSVKHQHSLEELDLEILKASASSMALDDKSLAPKSKVVSDPSRISRNVLREEDMNKLIDNIEKISVSDLESADSVIDITKKLDDCATHQNTIAPLPTLAKAEVEYKKHQSEVIMCPADLYPFNDDISTPPDKYF